MPDSAVIQVMRSFKADLLRGERAQVQAMAQRWLAVERRLSAQIDALAYDMAQIARDGGTVSPTMLSTSVRYRELLVQLTDELEGYSGYAERTITDRQRQLARLGIEHAGQAITTQGVRAGFTRLPVEAVTNLVGLSGSGSPLRSLLAASWPLAADGLTQELVTGVALGYNPRKIARNMAQGMARSRDRMEVIARTEALRTYKEANRQSYIASGVVRSYKRLATHDSRVCAACLLDEGTEYALGEEMPEHPQGRCTLVPVVDGVPQPKWVQGAEWFVEQPPATQTAILGKGRYEAWQRGAFDLGELVTVRPNATWGPSLQVTPLATLGSA
jgi:SPP1 gp7 family putative phage head morphogenesis protein